MTYSPGNDKSNEEGKEHKLVKENRKVRGDILDSYQKAFLWFQLKKSKG